jgi:hypothetical protein
VDKKTNLCPSTFPGAWVTLFWLRNANLADQESPMPSKTLCKLLLTLTAVFALGSRLPAQSTDSNGYGRPPAKTLTITVKGTLGPILSGSDPLGLNGENGSLAVKVSESLSPKKHTSNSATYTLPAGAITLTFGSEKFKTTSSSTMIVKLTSAADTLTLSAVGPDSIKVTSVAYLKTGSWTNAVLKHPTTFTPSPQKLTAAKSDNGPGSKVTYVFAGSTTVLGLSGTASSSDPAPEVFSEEFFY